MGHVTGPFIQYQCSRCGADVLEKVLPDRVRIRDRIFEANANPDRRLCASCWKPTK